VSKIVKLPIKFDLTAIYRFVGEVVSDDMTPVANVINFDFAELNHIDGSGLTALCNTIEWLRKFDTQILFSNNTNLKRSGLQYLDACGFFRRYLGNSLSSHSRVSNATLPCQAVSFAAAHGWLEYQFTPWMAQTLYVSESSLGTLRTCLKELFNNIGDHSTVGTGFVHVQHYPARHSVGVTLSDFGIGIPGSMAVRYPGLADEEAIRCACEEGVTSKSRSTNMGVGLSLLCQSILASQGAVRIHSLSGYLHRWVDVKGKHNERVVRGSGIYPGTLIDLQLDTRLFVGDDDTREDVEW
jgi:hypothetical protein